MVPSGRGLPAASKTNLMARPPARAGGRSGLLTGGESGNPNGYSLPFSQRVPSHIPSPPSRWAGRYGPFAVRAAGRVSCKKYGLPPHNPTREGESRGRTSSLWVLPPFLPKKWGPGWASQGSLPFQRRKEKTRNAPRLGGPRSRPFQRRREPHHTPPLETVPPERRPP